MKSLKAMVLEEDLVYATCCFENYRFFSGRDAFWSKMYWETFQDLIQKKRDYDTRKLNSEVNNMPNLHPTVGQYLDLKRKEIIHFNGLQDVMKTNNAHFIFLAAVKLVEVRSEIQSIEEFLNNKKNHGLGPVVSL